MTTFMQAAANWPEDEGRASAKHWNEVIRFEDKAYRDEWLAKEQARWKLIFEDESHFDRYCAEFLKLRIAEL